MTKSCYFILAVFAAVHAANQDCACTGTGATPDGTCSVDYISASNFTVTGCKCATAAEFPLVNTTSATYEIYCSDTTTTTTTTVATTTTTSVEVCTDENANFICDDEEKAEELRCYNSTMSTGSSDMCKYILTFGGIWIILWCLATIIVNFSHKNKGHQRWIHFYEEIAIILLMLFVAILNLWFHDDQSICRVITILSQFFMVLVAAAFLMEACFANSMVHGNSKKNGSIPPVLNYIVPIVIALIPTLVTYFTEKDDYAASLLHCFVSLTSNMMWGFIIPVWLLLAAAVFKAQLACLACDKTKEEQDQEQCFWAKKSAKSLALVAFLLFSIWLTIMHAFDQLVMYLFIVAFLLCLVFGPFLFVAHTFCHLNTCNKWAKTSLPGKFYSLCPEQQPKIIYEEKIVYKDRDPDPLAENAMKNRHNPVSAQPPIGESHTQAQQFYSWLFDPQSSPEASNDILFRPKPQ